MHPFTTPSGGAIDQGRENESVTSKVIQNYLRSLSKNEFRGGKIREHGLIVNKSVKSCATSPDKIFPFYKKDDERGRFEYYGICVIEIKTNTNLNTIGDLEK